MSVSKDMIRCDLCGKSAQFSFIPGANPDHILANAILKGWRWRDKPNGMPGHICPACWNNAQEEQKHNGGNLE